MGVPLIQQYRIGRYLLQQRFAGNRRYPLVLMLEPLLQCNLACAGCGKLDYPGHILRKRLPVDDTSSHPLKALACWIRGRSADGFLAPGPPVTAMR